MNQYDTILALLGWIESNLTKRLTIERVSDKSGYTKFHLKIMFKSVTGSIICVTLPPAIVNLMTGNWKEWKFLFIWCQLILLRV